MGSILVTGGAGFIGFHLCSRLLERGDNVVTIDNLNDYYSVRLKKDRLELLEQHPGFQFRHADLADKNAVDGLFAENDFDAVVNLAAQAGVRYSAENPHAYISSNIVGFTNILEACRHTGQQHLVYASSSSVYGLNRKTPFAEADRVDTPTSVYAATKRSNELLAHSYSHMFGLPTTGLRFFTVYGPWGRPDMAIYKFADAIVKGRPIDVYNYGDMQRDFTYIDDIVEGLLCVIDRPQTLALGESAPHQVYNIGNNQPVALLQFIELLEQNLGIEAEKRMLPMQPGEVHTTYADIDLLANDFGFRPTTSIEDGVRKFITWYKAYHGASQTLPRTTTSSRTNQRPRHAG